MIFGIVGLGRFGKLWARSLLPYGDVKVYDQTSISVVDDARITVTTLPDVLKADIVFLIMPISTFEKACEQIKGFLDPKTLIVDCCSVKIYPIAVMNRIFAPNQAKLATHPLFGPDSVERNGGLKNLKIVVCPFNPNDEKTDQLYQIFVNMGLHILITTPEEHDKQMANSQSLVHFIGRGLATLNLHEQELATPDFQALLNINNMVIHDTWQLFLDMHRYNPYAKNIRKTFLQQLSKLDKDINMEIPDVKHQTIAK